VPEPAVEYSTVAAVVESPVRVTVNVNGVIPEIPSDLLALKVAMLKPESSFKMVPVAVIGDPKDSETGLERETKNVSFDSTVVSAFTLTVNVFNVSVSAKATVPVGNDPPKSATSAAFVPVPLTVKLTDPVPVPDDRVAVNVNEVVPVLPSRMLGAPDKLTVVPPSPVRVIAEVEVAVPIFVQVLDVG